MYGCDRIETASSSSSINDNTDNTDNVQLIQATDSLQRIRSNHGFLPSKVTA
ncbi:unnamed protein product [Brugia pahangi]|uniref:Uncharacterized protein n=1 Tax=Brugia pahangi TaxID=6280 RepID=A0A0N4TGK6_BRUPA|nr:unnamed protein product [Brugia pahangi]VDN88929.1 unnamed protein product [Brugia pahangi]